MVALVLVDGQCVLCDGFCQLISQLDSGRKVYFATQQSRLGLGVLQAKV